MPEGEALRVIKYHIVSAETGEIIQEIAEDEFIKIIGRKPPDKPQKGFRRTGGKFVKVCQSAVSLWMDSPPGKAESSLILLLCQHLRHNSCEVRHKNGRIISIEWLCKESGLSKTTTLRALSSLEQAGYIKRNTSGRLDIYVNPYFCQKGQVIPEEVHKMFENTDFYQRFNESECEKR